MKYDNYIVEFLLQISQIICQYSMYLNYTVIILLIKKIKQFTL